MDTKIDQAITRYEQGERGEAKSLAESLIKPAPKNGDALNLLVVIALDESRSVDAEKYARAAVATAPLNPVYLNTLGNTLSEPRPKRPMC